ncbi:MAG: response regulator [Clostridiales bacterium]|nr:response regulator [Clostridiales bacterium]
MIRLLIVDDEKVIRDGLTTTMDWEKMDITVVGTAKDGKEALELCELWHPHIVLTDVRMPKMNGLELMKHIKEKMPNIKVIILSGHDEFAYAKEALKYGAVDYLIKPVVAEELEVVLGKLIDKMCDDLYHDSLIVERYREMNMAFEQYFNAVKTGDYEGSKTHLLKMVNEFVRKKIPIDHFQRLCTQIVTTFLAMLKDAGYNTNTEFFQPYKNVHRIIMNYTKPKELIEWLNDFNNEMIHWIMNNKEDNHATIRLAIDYIDKHYSEFINTEVVAEAVALSSNYFSHLFKKCMGESFTDYLNRKRIEKAKELLHQNTYKIYEVADMVGYKDYKYFSIVFKKLVGVSPIKYIGIQK